MELSTSGAVTELRTIVSAPLDQASAIMPQVYICPEFNWLEVERIFAREWMCVGRAGSLAEPGNFLTYELAGQPAIVIHDSMEHCVETFYETHVRKPNWKLLAEDIIESYRLPVCHQITIGPQVLEPPSSSRVPRSMRGDSTCVHDIPDIARDRA